MLILDLHLQSAEDQVFVQVQERRLVGAREVHRHPETRHRAHAPAVHPLLQDLRPQQDAAGLLPVAGKQEENFSGLNLLS